MQGGVGAFTRELAKALAEQGHTIHVITHKDARPAVPEGEQRRLAQLRQPVDLGFATLHPRARRWGWGDVRVIVDVALRYDLDVVNIQYQAAAYNMRHPAINLAPWRLKGLVTTIVTFHDLRVPYLFPKAGRLRKLAVHFMAKQAHGVVATNNEDYRTLCDLRHEAGSVRQIPIGSNIRAGSAAEDAVLAVRRRLAVGDGDFLLGYFGFLNASKGADLLLEALAQVDAGVHLVFIGGRTGSSDRANNQAFLERLEADVGNLGLQERVHWTGFLPDEAVSAHLKAADLVVLPYRDGVSLRRGTLMAALAHARPIVTTSPSTKTPQLVHGENVWLVPRGDAAALAAAISRLRAEPHLRQELAAGAYTLAQQFTWERIAARTADYYAGLET
jgi:glycosyltransferase involved in cell wall biosynthesis